MTTRTLGSTVAAAVMIAAGVFACGGQSGASASATVAGTSTLAAAVQHHGTHRRPTSSSGPSGRQSKPAAAPTEVSNQSGRANGQHGPVTIGVGGAVTITGQGTVSTVIMVDRTALRHHDPALTSGYLDSALQMAAPTIARGGTLSVQAFGRVAGQALDVYTTKIPSLQQAGPAARDDAGQTALLTHVLDFVLGIEPAPNHADAQALAAVSHPYGSDIAGAVRVASTQLASDPAPIHDVLILTDGWIIEGGQPSLSSILTAHGTQAAARQILADAHIPRGTRPLTMLQIAGLASTSGHISPAAPIVNKLSESWTLAASHMDTQEWAVSPQS